MADGRLEGMMLAAVIADDERGDAVSAALPADTRAALAEGLASLADAPREQRRKRVSAMAAALRYVDPQISPPPSVARLLASEVPREVGRDWLAGSPAVRRGYRPEPGIKALLRRCVGSAAPEVAEEERRAAETVDVVFSPSQAASLRRWTDRLAADRKRDRTLGALALGARSAMGSPPAVDRADSVRRDAHTQDLFRIGAELAQVWSTPWRA